MTWANQYPAGVCEINGIHVHRFPVDTPRRREVFDEVNGRFLRGEICSNAEEDGWFVAQGPYSLALLEALRREHDNYDVFLMCTYLYFQTACGTELVRDKAILIPMTHDEPYLQLRRIRRLFHLPKAFLFLTDEERDLVYTALGWMPFRLPWAGQGWICLPMWMLLGLHANIIWNRFPTSSMWAALTRARTVM